MPAKESDLDEIALDQSGNRKKLNQKQLDDIRATGEFEVESKYFPGKYHRWELAKWLQKGHIKSTQTLYQVIFIFFYFNILLLI
jgi:hypothetical protein